ncbi:MAG: glycosyltransferase family 2 protein [Paracoccus denitrificans]|nr:MAG: glycosyltransferase family 2 protein [Paracoccus denitrificans]PZO84927.1 MAG: glycosyltransferase family 2 protein [Paracoccus denitrificans]
MTDPATDPSVSVIIVSRGRRGALTRCLTALQLQSLPGFEVVLVADPASILIRPDLPMRRVVFDVPNISRARNAGINAATGHIVAFIDDDAVPEPGWLAALTAPFADPRVLAATGFTRLPDGFAFQATAHWITPDGVTAPLHASAQAVSLHAPADGCAVCTLGTNCAFRRDALAALGGFDPAFPFHLDESDVNMRMARACPDCLTAIVPGAEVTHGLADDPDRRQNGVTSDQSVTLQSIARFCARYGGNPRIARNQLRRRTLRQMVDGAASPETTQRLLDELDAAPAPTDTPEPPSAPLPDSPFPRPIFFSKPQSRIHHILTGWQWNAPKLRSRAAVLAEEGAIVTLILLTPTFLPHRVTFRPSGWWEQQGGLWGASDPGDPPLMAMRKAARLTLERTRTTHRREPGAGPGA